MSDFTRARGENAQLLALARQANDLEGEGIALAEMGWASVFAHNFEQALADAGQAIDVAEQADVKQALARAYLTTGLVHMVTGQLDQSKQELNQSLAISRPIDAAAYQSLALALVGMHQNWEGEYSTASRLIADGLQIARTHQLMEPLLVSFFYLGVTLIGKGDYDTALALLDEGLTLAEKVGAEVYCHRLLNSLGWLYIELGDLDPALDFNRRCAERARVHGAAETIANAEINLGDIHLAQGDLTLAHEYFDSIHRLVQDPATSPWNRFRYSTHLFASLGEFWLARGDLDQAQTFADQSLAGATRIHARRHMTKSLRLKGDIALARRQWDAAEGWLQQALPLAQAVGNPTQIWKTHLALGRLHSAAKRPEQARQAYHAACQVIDQIKANIQNSTLQAGLEQSPLIRNVYALTTSG